MRKKLTRKLGLTLVGLLPLAALHAQSLEPQAAFAKALAARDQWAGTAYPAADLRLSSAYAEPNGLEHVYVQQLYRGIPVYNRMQSLAFKGSKLAAHAGNFASAKQLAALPATPTVSAAAAVSLALKHLEAASASTPALLKAEEGPEARQTFAGAGVARHDIVASLTWAFDAAQRPHLAWNVNIDLLGTPDWWNVRIDAATGAFVDQDNWTANEGTARPAKSAAATRAVGYQPLAAVLALAPPPPNTTTSSYLVVPFPRERPTALPLQTETDPWLKAGSVNNATTNGWHFDGTTNYNTTRGNNVSAYDDAANANAPGNYATSLTPAPALSFNYAPDFLTTPSSVANRNAAVTNLFYWSNIIHDVTYQYGFTEAAGNFQADNISRGGLGGDYVKAEAQDGSGTNNANFSTPPDGTSGRMQMYLWSGITPTYYINVTAPTTVAGNYVALESGFSTNNKLITLGPVSGQLALYADAASSPTTYLACGAYGGTTPLTGKIALLYRGTCGFSDKVKNAQLAGAIAALVINNAAGAPIVMGGTDNTVTIPAVMVSQADGAILAAQIASGVQVTLPKPAASGPQIDGDYDNGVVTHEYGHGVSTRLTGGPANSSCLGNAEQGGEGWSDYLALMLTTNWATAQLTDGPNARPVGTYAAGQATAGAGIRRYPYSTSLTTNPLTYANVATSTEVHNIGEVWCAALWDMTWNIIQQRGLIQPNLYNTTDPGGNTIALQLMMQGLKLQPCQPGFLDARDAILAADSLLYNGQYHCSIWNAFARRGMGFSAVQGLSTSATDQVAAFDTPPNVILQKQSTIMSGNTFTVSFKLSCGCQPAAAPYTLTDELPAGMQYVSSTGGTLVGNKVTFSNLTFATPGQTQTLSFQAQATAAAACTPVLPVNDNRETLLLGGFANQILTGTDVWSPSTLHANSGANAWAAPAPAVPSDFVLTSTPFTPTGLSTLSFYHYYDFEATYDGGMVELSSDNGVTWQNAATYFVQNGYNSTFDATTTTPGRGCFSGRSVSGNTRFIRSVLDLRSFVGQSMRVRFRTNTDSGSPGTFEGWFVDDIQVANGCGGNQTIELRTGANTVQTSQIIVTYLLPNNPLGTQAATLASASQFSTVPNPFGAQGLQLQLSLPTRQAGLDLTLYDVTGRALLRRTVAQAAAGTSTLSWPEAANLPTGLYLMRVALPDGSSTTLRVERE
jgi:extracellular elastinolytic metalloproteinase